MRLIKISNKPVQLYFFPQGMTGKVKVTVHQQRDMANKLEKSPQMDDFNRWKVDDLKKFIKEIGHKTTYRVKRELVAVAFALYL